MSALCVAICTILPNTMAWLSKTYLMTGAAHAASNRRQGSIKHKAHDPSLRLTYSPLGNHARSGIRLFHEGWLVAPSTKDVIGLCIGRDGGGISMVAAQCNDGLMPVC